MVKVKKMFEPPSIDLEELKKEIQNIKNENEELKKRFNSLLKYSKIHSLRMRIIKEVLNEAYFDDFDTDEELLDFVEYELQGDDYNGWNA